MSIVSLIAAVSENGVIGSGGKLPWRLPDELARFKRITNGHAVIMGRRTWESLGRALPGRLNIVISRRPDFEAPGAVACRSLQEALRRAADDEEVFVIGGAALFAEAYPIAERFYLTKVHGEVPGDTFFPPWQPEDWIEVSREEHPKDERHPYAFTFLQYRRRRAPAPAPSQGGMATTSA